MPLDIRLATLDDAATCGALIHAMDVHYTGARAPSAEAATAMVRHALETAEGSRFTLALDGGMPVGIACWVVMRPGSALSGVLFVKDLFVVAEARGTGVGRALLGALARHARAHGLGRIDLTTDLTNRAAQRFYDMLGGEVREKLFYRFSGAVLERMADE